MKIKAKTLKNVVDINHWQHSPQANISEGQANSIYIQLVDSDWSNKSTPEKSFLANEYPIRYLSRAAVFEVKARFLSIDDSQEFEIIASQPFADDKSIFKFSLTSAQIPNAGNFIIVLTEDGISKSFVMNQSITVELLNKGSC